MTKNVLKTILLGLLILFYISIMLSSTIEGFTLADILKPDNYIPSYPNYTSPAPTSNLSFTLAPT
jgi:hypothetical protein